MTLSLLSYNNKLSITVSYSSVHIWYTNNILCLLLRRTQTRKGPPVWQHICSPSDICLPCTWAATSSGLLLLPCTCFGHTSAMPIAGQKGNTGTYTEKCQAAAVVKEGETCSLTAGFHRSIESFRLEKHSEAPKPTPCHHTVLTAHVPQRHIPAALNVSIQYTVINKADLTGAVCSVQAGEKAKHAHLVCRSLAAVLILCNPVRVAVWSRGSSGLLCMS